MALAIFATTLQVSDKSDESVEEVLEELSKYTGYILDLVEKHRDQAMFNAMHYKTEEYYNEAGDLKKILHLLRFLLK